MEEKNTERKPELVVFAGPNGSGKSTFTSPPWIIGAYINADDNSTEPTRIFRKHKEAETIFVSSNWSENRLLRLVYGEDN